MVRRPALLDPREPREARPPDRASREARLRVLHRRAARLRRAHRRGRPAAPRRWPRGRSRLPLPQGALGPRLCDRVRPRLAGVRLRRARPRADRRRRAGVEHCLQAGAREVRLERDRAHARLRPRAREVRASPLEFGPVAGSSNGRTPGSGPGSLGSNPSPAATRSLRSRCVGNPWFPPGPLL